MLLQRSKAMFYIGWVNNIIAIKMKTYKTTSDFLNEYEHGGSRYISDNGEPDNEDEWDFRILG